MLTPGMKIIDATLCKENYDKPRQCIKKQRHRLADSSPNNQNYGFSVVIYICESWTIKKAKCQKMLLTCGVIEDSRVPWTAKRSN